MYVETHSLIIISYWNQFVHVPKWSHYVSGFHCRIKKLLIIVIRI
jgi:hypothetical protein